MDQTVALADCGHDPKPYASAYTTGYGTDATTGRTACFSCCNEAERVTMHARGAAGEAFHAYLSDDGKQITTWPGGELARVTWHAKDNNGWSGSEIHYVRAVDSDGRRWYGKNGGPGMAITIRPAKG